MVMARPMLLWPPKSVLTFPKVPNVVSSEPFPHQGNHKNAKNTFTIPGLGKLVLVNRKARMGRNPATGATIKIAAKRVVKFRVAKAAKDAILGTK
jgi:Bacterial DNA-binding protein